MTEQPTDQQQMQAAIPAARRQQWEDHPHAHKAIVIPFARASEAKATKLPMEFEATQPYHYDGSILETMLHNKLAKHGSVIEIHSVPARQTIVDVLADMCAKQGEKTCFYIHHGHMSHDFITQMAARKGAFENLIVVCNENNTPSGVTGTKVQPCVQISTAFASTAMAYEHERVDADIADAMRASGKGPVLLKTRRTQHQWHPNQNGRSSDLSLRYV